MHSQKRAVPLLPYRVFSQDKAGRIDGAALVASGARFFSARLESTIDGEGLVVRIPPAAPELPASLFRLSSRKATPGDLAEAREAEVRGRAAGMAALAERCPFVWEVSLESPSPDDPASSCALFTLCAVCAQVALGPVLPPDRATLFGVRGALERAKIAVSQAARH